MAAEIYLTILTGFGLGHRLHYGRELNPMDQVDFIGQRTDEHDHEYDADSHLGSVFCIADGNRQNMKRFDLTRSAIASAATV